MTTREITIEAPTTFTKVSTPGAIPPYDMELLTPMLGGGVKSWIPDSHNPIRSQAIKGHLRFWWRTMQCCQDPATLKAREDALWGSTAQASTVRLAVTRAGGWETKTLSRNDKGYVQYENFPPYVLFPLQGNKEEAFFTVVTKQKFQLALHCRMEDREAVEASVKLWVLFGGIGARTKRGCGSIACQQIMNEFSSAETIQQFLRNFQCAGRDANPFATAPYPQLQNCRFAWDKVSAKGDATAAWKGFLDEYGAFRQGEGKAREPSKPGLKHPGPTRWPEADAIRRLSGKKPGLHTAQAHPAGTWFPRAAYGLPILTKFKDQAKEPTGQLTLAPAGEGQDRWPSPVILKIIRLASGDLLKTCLILNQQLPERIKLVGPDIKPDHILTKEEMPLSFHGKAMPANAPLRSATSPYDGIIASLNLKET